jgi:hypothetical protein
MPPMSGCYKPAPPATLTVQDMPIKKRSQHVTAPLLAAAALSLLAACKRGPEMQRCVDENNHVVDPSFCAAQPTGGGNTIYPGYHPIYRYYYGGSGGYGIGSTVTEGGYTPVTGHAYSTTSGTARGGFGSSHGGEGGGGHGGGGGE